MKMLQISFSSSKCDQEIYSPLTKGKRLSERQFDNFH